MNYVGMIVDFGFSISATREISIARGDRAFIGYLFSRTIITQAILFLLAIIGGVIISLLSSAPVEPIILIFASLQVLASLAFPSWLFQGLEMMRLMSIVQISARLASLPLIFLFVKNPQDIIEYLISISLPPLAFSICGTWWALRHYHIKFRAVSFSDIRATIHDGIGIFSSKLLTSSYTSLLPIALGLIAGPIALAQFSLADRFRNTLQNLLSIISTAYFPHSANLFASDVRLFERNVYVALALSVLAAAFPVGVILLFAHEIIYVFGGRAFQPAADVLRILALIPMVVAISSVASTQVLLASGAVKRYTSVIGIGSLISLITIFPAAYFYGAVGIAALWLGVEFIICLIMWVLALRILSSMKFKEERTV
jgi:O-antigen/teichoic acid export membrane protein